MMDAEYNGLMAEKIRLLQAENVALRKVLEPFAKKTCIRSGTVRLNIL